MNARSWKQRLVAAAAAGLAVFLAVYLPAQGDLGVAIVGGVAALVAAALAFAAVANLRPMPSRSAVEYARLAAVALGLGSVVGMWNLGANYGLAALDARIHDRMMERWAGLSPWSTIVAAPVIEEIAFRLFLLGGVAWLAARTTTNHRTIFLVALGVSALLFGAAHILIPMPVGGALGVVHASGLVIKTGIAGLVLGWVFWQWGLPYSIACHGAANAAHLLLEPALF